MADRTGIIVKILGDSSSFKKAANDAASASDKFSNVLKGVGMGLGMAAFDLAKDVVGDFVGQLGAAGEAYRADQVSQMQLATALKNNVTNFTGSTKAVEDYAEAQGRLGFMDDDVRQSIAQLVGITHDEAKAMELNSLAQDLARSKGIDLASATDIVTKAAQGNGKALKALGVDIGGATDAAGMLDAIQKNVKGSAEAWADTSEGKLAAANVKQDAAWEKIGSVVDKFSTAILPVAADAFSVVADMIVGVADAIQPIVDKYGPDIMKFFNQVADVVGPVINLALQGLSDTILPAVGKAMEVMWSFAKPILDVWLAAVQKVIDAYLWLDQLMNPTKAKAGDSSSFFDKLHASQTGSGSNGKIGTGVALASGTMDTGPGNLAAILHPRELVADRNAADWIRSGGFGALGAMQPGYATNVNVNIGNFTANSSRDVDRLAAAIAQRIRSTRR